ncbi:MAG: hypothetical protein ABIY55_01845 [Kofleriaceae bacterium]
MAERASWRERGLPIEIIEPPPLTVDQLARAHDRDHVEDILAFIKGVGVTQRSMDDLIQDCPVCGPFRRHPDGTVELHITPGSPLSIRPIDWCVTELTTSLHQAVPSENARTAMAESGALRTVLESLRGKYDARGVDFDAVMNAIVADEELVSSHSPATR